MTIKMQMSITVHAVINLWIDCGILSDSYVYHIDYLLEMIREGRKWSIK